MKALSHVNRLRALRRQSRHVGREHLKPEASQMQRADSNPRPAREALVLGLCKHWHR